MWIPSWTFVRRAAIAAGCVGVVGVVGVVGYVGYLSRDLPDVRELSAYEPPITSRVHAGDGRLIHEFASEHRVFVPYDSIPTHVVNAFTAAEDKNFFSHGGIDWVGTTRGVMTTVGNKLTGKSGLAGGSTISQQVAKNMLLTNDRTIERKIKEMVITRRMERAFSKDQIMELYLNEIYLGGRSYGVGSAALNYFGKSLPELNLAEAATLAALAQLPGRVNPYTNPELLVRRRNYVLRRMVEDGHITEEIAEEAKSTPLDTIRRLRGPEYAAAAYFVEELRRDLVEQYGDEALYEGGLSIRSTIDTRLQLAAQDALQSGLEAYDRRHGYRGPFAQIGAPADLNEIELPGGSGEWEPAFVERSENGVVFLTLQDGAEVKLAKEDVEWAETTFEREGGGTGFRRGDAILVDVERAYPEAPDGASEDDIDIDLDALPPPVGDAILRQVPEVDGALLALDPNTGRVLAMAGGYSFWKSQFNRVTQAERQPGSSFKPFVYAAALEQGYTPVTKVLDAPFVDYDASTDDFWTPKNYTEGRYYGLSTIRVGLEQSRNLMTVRMAQDIGMEPVVDVSERVGLYDDLDPYLAMSLGAGETTMLRMARAYAALANGGHLVEPTLLDRVQDRYGRTLYRHDQRPCERCDSEAWSGGPPPELPDTREKVLDPVVAYQVTHMLEGVVERGTGRRAARIEKPLAGKTGTSNDAFDAWFMGMSPDLVVGVWVGFDTPKTLGAGETGGSTAAPIFTDFMEAALVDTPALPFRIPPGVRLVEVDAETGQQPGPGTTSTVLEAFRPGTEPGAAFDEDNALNIFGPQDTGLFGPAPERRPVDPLEDGDPVENPDMTVADEDTEGIY